jgi:hypothetical protein
MNQSPVPELRIRYQSIGSLVPYSRNARTHSKHQIRQIAESMKLFGFTNPILIDNHNTIIAWYGRVAAAKLLGIKEIPTVRLESLSDDQIRAYLFADNRLAEKAGWEKSILAIELQHLMALDIDFDVTVTGFEIPEIDFIIEGAKEGTKSDKDDDVAGLGSGPATTRLGDVWTLGKHRYQPVRANLNSNLLSSKEYRSMNSRVLFTDA